MKAPRNPYTLQCLFKSAIILIQVDSSVAQLVIYKLNKSCGQRKIVDWKYQSIKLKEQKKQNSFSYTIGSGKFILSRIY